MNSFLNISRLPLPLRRLPRISTSFSKWNCPTFLYVNVTEISCIVSRLFLNGYSASFLFFVCGLPHVFLPHFFIKELPHISFNFSVKLPYLISSNCHINFLSLLLKVHTSLFLFKPLVTFKLCGLPHISTSFYRVKLSHFSLRDCHTNVLYCVSIISEWTLLFVHTLYALPHIFASFSKWVLHYTGSYLIISSLVNIIWSFLVTLFVFHMK